MKKLFSLLLCCAAFMCFSTACSDDDDDPVVTNEMVLGTWNVVWAKQDGEATDVPKGTIYITLTSDNKYEVVTFADRYIGSYKLEGNTVVGTTLDPITERFKFTRIDGMKADIDYSNSLGERIKFKAEKK